MKKVSNTSIFHAANNCTGVHRPPVGDHVREFETNSSSQSDSSAETPRPRSPEADKSTRLVVETMSYATEALSSIKGWASPTIDQMLNGTVDDKQDANKNRQSSSNGASKKRANSRERAARQSLVNDLMSPFMACHSGLYGVTATEHYQTKHPHMKDLYTSSYPAYASANLSMDTQLEDEMLQIQRLTSWGTMASVNSVDTATTAPMMAAAAAAAAVGANGTQPKVVLRDDDGVVIDPLLLKKRREQRRRKKLVKFDYPPISSLRECPRPDPNDLPDLFFTEEELDEIEADRYSTHAADDVEIVAVSSAGSDAETPTSTRSSPRPPTPGTAPTPQAGTVSSSSTTSSPMPPLKRKPRSSSPHPSRPARGTYDKQKSQKYLIKGVQIYLRERSTGTTPRR